MQKMALWRYGVASLFSCNRVIIRFRVLGNGGFVRLWHWVDIRSDYFTTIKLSIE